MRRRISWKSVPRRFGRQRGKETTLGIFGEDGPEVLIPLDQLSTGTSQVFNTTIEGPIFGLDELDRKINESIRRTVKRGGLKSLTGPRESQF